ncbi:MAG: FapA family protein [Bacillota bacterium]|nr:FapA family protein [Bacillota bacterium]
MSDKTMDHPMQNAADENQNDANSMSACDIKVAISSDYLRAKISIHYNDPKYRLSKERIMDALKEKNVSFGIHTHIVEELARSAQDVSELEIAAGIPIENGENGVITYTFDLSNVNKPKINEDGTVDFKNTNFLLPVKKGDVLAERSMPTGGKDGTLVTGKVMRARPGRIVNFKVGKNVAVDDDGLRLIALSDGCIQMDGDKISVIQFLEIKGDVGIATGNIDFAGKVLVHGNVTSGYRIKATDDITIYGLVESATVETDGNLTINHGVQGGEAAHLKVGGELVTKFVNSATVDCRGPIRIDAIMHSDVICDDDIIAEGKNGLIVGGKVYSKKNIVAKCIGSRMGTTTFVTAGVSPEMIKNYKDLEEERNLLLESIAKIDKLLQLVEARKDTGGEENEAIGQKSLALRTEHEQKLKNIEDTMREMGAFIRDAGKSIIKVADVYPGVRLKIDSTYHSIKEQILEVIFKKEKNEVVMVPWEE